MKYELFVLQMKIYKNLKESKEDIEKEIDDLCYQYCGVKAIRYDKQIMNHNNSISDEIKLKLSEVLDEPQKELDIVNHAINQLKPTIKSNLSKLPDDVRKATKLLFWEKKTYHEVGLILGYSDNGLWHKVRREIEKL